MDVDSYIVCLAYVVRLLSLIKSIIPKVVNSCIPTLMNITFHEDIKFHKEEVNILEEYI